jgi:hypothetical protein
MINKFDNYLLESMKFDLKDENFWNDWNDTLKNTIYNNGNFLSFWDFLDKYSFSYLNKDQIEKAYDKLFVGLHNKNKIPKRITFSEYIYMWSNVIKKIYDFYEKTDKNLANKLFENPLNFLKNEKVKIYRGISKYRKENLEYVEENQYKSFSLDINIAMNFTQYNWAMRSWKDVNSRNGFILETEIFLKDAHLFSEVGYEHECIMKGRLDYTKKYIVENGKII